MEICVSVRNVSKKLEERKSRVSEQIRPKNASAAKGGVDFSRTQGWYYPTGAKNGESSFIGEDTGNRRKVYLLTKMFARQETCLPEGRLIRTSRRGAISNIARKARDGRGDYS